MYIRVPLLTDLLVYHVHNHRDTVHPQGEDLQIMRVAAEDSQQGVVLELGGWL